jgi:hypothetical protein
MVRSWLGRVFVESAPPQRRRPLASRTQVMLRWSIAIGYLLLALGVPLPLSSAKSSGEAYPCMDHLCGCGSAEVCWRHCCCLSLVEKLTWARDHHVNPPIYVILEARQHGIDWIAFCSGKSANPSMQCQSHCAHCSQCGSSTVAAVANQNSEKSPQLAADVNSKSRVNDRHSHGIVLNEMLKCRGAAQHWLSLSSSLAPPTQTSFTATDEIVAFLNVLSERANSLSSQPPAPPPRFFAA